MEIVDDGAVGYWLRAWRTSIDLSLDRPFWEREGIGFTWPEWVAYWLEAAAEAEKEVLFELVRG